MKPKHADDGMHCPLYRKACVKVCHTCEFWDHIRGKNPQTGQDIDYWACTMKMHTMLQIEHTMVARQTTASVDELRKEVHQGNDQAMVGAIAHLNQQVRSAAIASDVPPAKLIGN